MVVGRLHGAGIPVFYLAARLVTASRLRWPGWALLLGMLAAIPPLVTMPLEWWLRRKGLSAAAAAWTSHGRWPIVAAARVDRVTPTRESSADGGKKVGGATPTGRPDATGKDPRPTLASGPLRVSAGRDPRTTTA